MKVKGMKIEEEILVKGFKELPQPEGEGIQAPNDNQGSAD